VVKAIEQADTTALTSFALQVGDWYAAELSLPNDDTLRITFRERGGGDEIFVTVVPRDAPAPVFKRLENCAIRYSAKLTRVTQQRRAEVSALLLAIGSAIDERLSGGGTIASTLGAERAPRRAIFSREMLRAFLAPELGDAPAAGGWVLHDIYPSSQRRLTNQDELELVIELRRDLRRALFSVGRADDRPALVRTKNFSVVEIVGARTEIRELEPLRALLSFVFQLRDHDALEVVFPSVLADLGLRALPPASEAPRIDGSLNLALDAECDQQCAFCSVKSASPAYDGGDAVYARAVSDLEASRARGVHRLRLNGYDPLAFSRVLDVLATAKSIGFDHVDIFSPCTRVADRSFADQLFEQLPSQPKFFVPIYATDAMAHDRFVGRDGAHALVMRAIDNILALGGSIHVLSVVTEQTVGELTRLHLFARERGLAFSAHMPYPMNEGRDDRYFSVVPRQTDVAAAMERLHRGMGEGRHDIPVYGVAPCVTFRTLREKGLTPWHWLLAGPGRRLPGTEYDRKDIEHGAGDRSTDAFRVSTIECPQAAQCALLPACGGSILRAYIERHGSDEFVAVDLRTLIEAR
jgi:MoaA/NifB/PqqE/SkfB family radical SAM enzyme